MFSKQLKGLDLDAVKALLASKKLKLERYNSNTKLYEDFSQYADVTYYDEESGEVLLELNKDWTEIYDTVNTKENYYNDKFKLSLAKDSVKAEANGEKNDALSLDLNYAGSPLNSPDLKSAEITTIDRYLLTNDFTVMMSEPVKLRGLDQSDTPLINAEGTVLPPKTTVEFIGKDKNGKTVTIDGSVVGYTDSSDMNFRVAANEIFSISSIKMVTEKSGKSSSSHSLTMSVTRSLQRHTTLKFRKRQSHQWLRHSKSLKSQLTQKMKKTSSVSSSQKVFNTLACTMRRTLHSTR